MFRRIAHWRNERQAQAQMATADRDHPLGANPPRGPTPYDAGLTHDPHQTWDQYLHAEFGVEPDAAPPAAAESSEREAGQ